MGKFLDNVVKIAAKLIYKSPSNLLIKVNNLLDRDNKYSDKLDPDVKTSLIALNKFVDSNFVNLSPSEARGLLENDSGLAVAPKNDRVQLNDITIGSLSGICAIPVNVSNTAPIIIYLHGGGWVLGSASTETDTIGLLADKTSSIVISLDYPLAPESTYQEMLETISEVVDICMDKKGVELLGNSYLPSAFGMTGDSAGGHLTAAVNIYRIKMNKKQVDIQVPVVPVTDLNDFDTRSYLDYQKGYYLTRDQMIWYRRYFTEDKEANWKAYSPMHEDPEILKKLSKTHIAIAECDVLHEDGKKYYALLKDLGVDVDLTIAKGQLHIFPAAPYMWKGAYQTMLKLCQVFNEEFDKHRTVNS